MVNKRKTQTKKKKRKKKSSACKLTRDMNMDMDTDGQKNEATWLGFNTSWLALPMVFVEIHWT